MRWYGAAAPHETVVQLSADRLSATSRATGRASVGTRSEVAKTRGRLEFFAQPTDADAEHDAIFDSTAADERIGREERWRNRQHIDMAGTEGVVTADNAPKQRTDR